MIKLPASVDDYAYVFAEDYLDCIDLAEHESKVSFVFLQCHSCFALNEHGAMCPTHAVVSPRLGDDCSRANLNS